MTHSQTREMRVFLAASLINATGSALMWPLVSMFVFDELGRSMTDAGLVILLQSVGGIIGQFLGGALYYRIGVKRLIVGSLGLNALGTFSLPFISGHWYLFITVMGFIGLFNYLSFPAIQSFIGFRFAERRVELFNTIYIANNIGVALGTAMSGFLADISYSLSFIGNGMTSVLFASFFFIYLRKVDSETEINQATLASKRKKQAGTATERGSVWPLIFQIRIYLFMAIGTLLINLGNSVWNAGVSPFIIAEDMPKRMYGFLWTLNGVLIFVAQPLIQLIRRRVAKQVTAQMTVSSLFYLGGYACLFLQDYSGMVLGMILITFGEMLIAPAMPAYLTEYGGKNAPFYIGLSGSIGSIGRVIGPFAMGSFYDGGGLLPTVWLAVVTAGLSAGFYHLHAVLSKANRRMLVDDAF